MEVQPPVELEPIAEVTPSQPEVASVMNQPIGHLEPRTYSLRCRETAKKKRDAAFEFNVDGAVERVLAEEQRRLEPEHINTEHELLTGGGRAFFGDNPHQLVFEDQIPGEILSAWAHKQPLPAGERPQQFNPTSDSSDGSSVLPLREWADRRNGIDIRPYTERKLIPDYLSSENSGDGPRYRSVGEGVQENSIQNFYFNSENSENCTFTQSAGENFTFNPEHGGESFNISQTHLINTGADFTTHCAQASAHQTAVVGDAIQQPELIDTLPREPILAESINPASTQRSERISNINSTAEGCAGSVCSDTLIESGNTLATVTRNSAPPFVRGTNTLSDNGIVCNNNCGLTIAPSVRDSPCNVATPSLRAENRQKIYKTIRSRNNCQVTSSAPTQKERGRGVVVPQNFVSWYRLD